MLLIISALLSSNYSPNSFLVHAHFDIDRLADKVKTTRVQDSRPDDAAIGQLSKFFTPTALGVVEMPSTVVDQHGRIILWHLPDIIAPHRVVSGL